ncbi:uncharacterized protein LTR77_005279 [Saxophila tyrrhenica]|uniref:Uncharacterized protein n=1 Tax=Saxophila tyrrhenica TaxID=1690608 RepID=A0AAV9PE12_9PEZI|nr:hypothetical protein LTR77_005279 [Saxophila tyrrhenica]
MQTRPPTHIATVPGLRRFLTVLQTDIDARTATGSMPWMFIKLAMQAREPNQDSDTDESSERNAIKSLDVYVLPRKQRCTIDLSALGPAALIDATSSSGGLTFKSALESRDIAKVVLKRAQQASALLRDQFGILLTHLAPLGFPSDRRPDGPLPPLNDLLEYFQQEVVELANGDPDHDETVTFLRRSVARVRGGGMTLAELQRLSVALSDIQQS